MIYDLAVRVGNSINACDDLKVMAQYSSARRFSRTTESYCQDLTMVL